MTIPDTPRGRVLAAANAAVHRERNVTYGDVNSDFKRTARYWNTHLLGVLERKLAAEGVAPDPHLTEVMLSLIDPWDVAIMQGQLKHSRLAWSPGHTDNWTDVLGYGACGYDCVVAGGLAPFEGLPPTDEAPVDPEPLQGALVGDPDQAWMDAPHGDGVLPSAGPGLAGDGGRAEAQRLADLREGVRPAQRR